MPAKGRQLPESRHPHAPSVSLAAGAFSCLRSFPKASFMLIDSNATPRKAMTIAGSDSGGGAGIQADLKTFAAHGVYGTSVLTAVTAQNTIEVLAIAEVPEEVITLEIDGVMSDIGADAAKTGMLSSPSIIETVSDRIEAWGITSLVVDPVMVAKSGDRLLQADAVATLRARLLPLAMIVTPNIPEAEVLADMTIDSEHSMREAARRIHAQGPKFVVVKGGHSEGAPSDLIFDGDQFTLLEGERIDTRNTHGTGCTFSAAIAANLALGLEPFEATQRAKTFITEALRNSYPIGSGHSPVNHFFALWLNLRAATS
jgi:hydroxymethylpyrimidine/phosphomethylpyrimidine kinase